MIWQITEVVARKRRHIRSAGRRHPRAASSAGLTALRVFRAVRAQAALRAFGRHWIIDDRLQHLAKLVESTVGLSAGGPGPRHDGSPNPASSKARGKCPPAGASAAAIAQQYRQKCQHGVHTEPSPTSYRLVSTPLIFSYLTTMSQRPFWKASPCGQTGALPTAPPPPLGGASLAGGAATTPPPPWGA